MKLALAVIVSAALVLQPVAARGYNFNFGGGRWLACWLLNVDVDVVVLALCYLVGQSDLVWQGRCTLERPTEGCPVLQQTFLVTNPPVLLQATAAEYTTLLSITSKTGSAKGNTGET